MMIRCHVRPAVHPRAIKRGESGGLRSDTVHTDSSWIAAALNDEPDNDAVVHRAMSEARLRKASVLLIDQRVSRWIRRYPDVQVHTVAENSRATRCTQNRDHSIQLVIVGSADADNVAGLVDLNCHHVLRNTNSTVLLVRQ
jgi:hypothetical protein